MEIIGGIIISLAILVMLALVGVTTIFALGLMGALALLTNFNFKQNFLISYGVGFLATILLTAGVFAAVEEGSLERDLRAALPPPEEMSSELEAAIPKLEELRRDLESGNLEDEEIERRLEDLFSGSDSTGAPINVEGVEATTDGETVRIESD